MPGYEYFCGANVLVAVDGQAVMEVAGISYNLIDSSIPIYGYSSRLFDAVAPGQRIVQGSIAVNFTYPNYLYDAILRGGITSTPTVPDAVDPPALNATGTMETSDLLKLATEAKTSSAAWNNLEGSLQNQFWGPVGGHAASRISKDPLDMPNINIDIVFGGKYKLTLVSAYLIGRGTAVQIDENVIIEEYPFFARDLATQIF